MRKNRSKSSKKPKETEKKDEQNKITQKSVAVNLSQPKQLQLIQDTHNRIVIAPENDIKHIQTLFMLSKVSDLKVVITALRALAETFVIIAPLQPIDMRKSQERLSTKITKQELKVVKFEKLLVQQYERYLKMLKQVNSKVKAKNFKNDKEIFREFKKCILECCIKCYRTLWNFNHNKELNDLTLKFVKFQECRQFLSQMLNDKNIAMISSKARIISGIGKLIVNTEDERSLPQNLIKILNSTEIDTRYLKKDMDTLSYKKKQLKKKLYKEEAFQAKKQREANKNVEKGTLQAKRKKKEEKAMEKLRVKQEVNKEFAEGDAIMKNKQIVKHNSNILQELFYIYFKIIVERTHSTFLKDSLDGILKFSHLINIDLISALIDHLNTAAAVFREYWKQTNKIQFIELRLLIVFTGESIINGPLSVYNMDDNKMTTHFYKVFKDINNSKIHISQQIFRLLSITLEETFIKRRQLSAQIIGSFVREIGILLSQKEDVPKIYLLEFIRLLVYRHNKLGRMFEKDNEGFGLNAFNAMCEDPQCTNAINTEMLSFLASIKVNTSREYKENVKRIADQLSKQNFNVRMKDNLTQILRQELTEGF